MTKEEYNEKICPSCVNYEYKRNNEPCSKFEYEGCYIYCKNYRNWAECVRKTCRKCGQCDEI